MRWLGCLVCCKKFKVKLQCYTCLNQQETLGIAFISFCCLSGNPKFIVTHKSVQVHETFKSYN